jgi:hypothetical protein
MNKIEALQYVEEKYPAQFKVRCSHCQRDVAVRKDIFAKRVEKVYESKDVNDNPGNLKMLLTGYFCKKCQKKENKNLIGGKSDVKFGSVKVITDIEE